MAVNFGDNFNVGAYKAIDTRLVVNTTANLTDGTIQYPYKGMLVAVKNENGFVKTYQLTSEPLSGNPIPINNWQAVGAAGTLASLNDVSLTNSLKNGDVLLYGTAGKWTNRGPIVQGAAAGTSGNINFTFSDGTQVSIQVSGGSLENNIYSSTNFIYTGESYNMSLATLDSVLGAIAPAKPGNLTSTNLTSNALVYSAKVPSGLSGAWTPVAGTTISNYTISTTYNLVSPNPASEFNAGIFATPASYGTATHVRNGSSFVSRNLSLGAGTTSHSDANGTSNLNVTSITLYNSIWAKANATIGYTQNVEGTITHALLSTIAGTTNVITYNLDNVNVAPSFLTLPNFLTGVSTPVLKYLSGISYYGIGSTLSLSFTADTGIFNRCYHPTAVAVLTGNAIPSTNYNPGSTPVYTDTFIISNSTVTLNVANVSTGSTGGILNVKLQKPDGSNTVVSASYPFLDLISNRVNTYGTASGVKFEPFLDETNRLIQSTNTAFVSINPLANGEAQVLNGTLTYGDVDYPSKSGSQRYDRRFTVGVQNGGSMTFVGFNPTNISPYNTGSLNMYLWLETLGGYWDLGKPDGSINGTGDGSSLANSRGGKVSISGSTLNYTFDTFSTFSNSNQFRMIIVFNDNTQTITSVTIN